MFIAFLYRFIQIFNQFSLSYERLKNKEGKKNLINDTWRNYPCKLENCMRCDQICILVKYLYILTSFSGHESNFRNTIYACKQKK